MVITTTFVFKTKTQHNGETKLQSTFDLPRGLVLGAKVFWKLRIQLDNILFFT